MEKIFDYDGYRNKINILSVGDSGRPLSSTLISIISKYITEECKVVSDSQRSYHHLIKELNVI